MLIAKKAEAGGVAPLATPPPSAACLGADHDNAVALAQADDDYAHGLDFNDYLGEQATASANLTAQQTLANNGFTEAMGAADAAQTSSDAGVILTNADQIADALLGDSIADDKAGDLYNHAESDAYDGQQKNDALALWSQQTTDAIAYFNSLSKLDQTTPWGAQAAAQAQAQMALATTLAQAALTLTDATADAQDGQEDTAWDLRQTLSDTLAQLAHDQAYSDARATFNDAQNQAAATAALAAADAYFATLPLPPGEGWGEGALPLNQSWISGGLLANAPSAFTASYDYLNNVDDITTDGTMGWSWSVGPTTQPFTTLSNEVGGPQTFWALAIQPPYAPPNPWAGRLGWSPPGTPPPPPPGSWSTAPPPVPDVGATIYQDPSDPELSTKAADAPTAREPGASTEGFAARTVGAVQRGVRSLAAGLDNLKGYVSSGFDQQIVLRRQSEVIPIESALVLPLKRELAVGTLAILGQGADTTADVLDGDLESAAAGATSFTLSAAANSPIIRLAVAAEKLHGDPNRFGFLMELVKRGASTVDERAAERGEEAAPLIETVVLIVVPVAGEMALARVAAAPVDGTVLALAESTSAMRGGGESLVLLRGAASKADIFHKTLPWALNANGARSVEEATALARAFGVQIGNDVELIPVADELLPKAFASYTSIKNMSGTKLLTWNTFTKANGNVPIAFQESLLLSDEGILAVFGHELYEINALRAMFAARGSIPAGEIANLITPELGGSLHIEGVRAGDALVILLRGNSP